MESVRPGSCDIGQNKPKVLSVPVESKVLKFTDLPKSTQVKIKLYAKELHRKHPKMKPDRVQKLIGKNST